VVSLGLWSDWVGPSFILLTTPLYSSSARLCVPSTNTESTAEALQGS
jgi:hypothetical protein